MTPRPTSARVLCRLAPLALTLAVCLPVAPAGASSATAALLVSVHRGAFTLAGRPLPYLHGINYEGSPDRPWRMWQDGLFSPTLIGRDFDAMAAAGYNPVRIFIQSPLPEMVLAGDYSRLDTVVALAAARGLRLLITFNDDGDPDLRRVARVDGLIAGHLAGNPAIFGYDLRNEPNLVDLAGSIYPAGARLPLLSSALVAAYHERVSMAAATKALRSGAWSGGGFARFDARTLYYYLNARALLNQFLSANPAYPDVPAAPYWTRFLDLANRTLAAWLYVQLAAIHAGDHTHLVTVGYSSRFWSALPANNALDFRSIHIYPPADFYGFHAALRRFEALQALAPSPLLLEEYGVSNDLNGRQTSAVREMAAALYLRTLGGGGDLKWMYDDDAVGYNAYENNLGAVDAHGQPKPTFLASAAANAYWGQTPYRAGLILQPDPRTGAGFVYVARDAMAIGGSQPYADARVRYSPRGVGILWLDWSTPGLLRITPTTGGTLTVALGALLGATALIAPLTPTSPLSPTASTASLSPTAPATLTIAASSSPTTTEALNPTAPSGQIAPRAGLALSPTATLTSATTITPTSTYPATQASPTPTVLGASVTITPTATQPPLPVVPTVTASPPAAVTLPTAIAARPTLSGATGLTVTLTLRAGVPMVLAYRAAGPPPPVPIDLPAPALGTAWYMVARGHNVAPPFLTPWLSLGGVATLGLPLTEAFAYHGLPTQYFDTVALRIGPLGPTTAPIGLVALHGAARPAAPELPARIKHVYDRATGHNIHGFFLDFWRRHGGLRFWGDPLTEELKEHGRLVQYFSGAEFALTTGPRVDVELLPLGRRMWPSIRSVYGL